MSLCGCDHFRRIRHRLFDGHRIMLEQPLIKLLIGFHPPRIVPFAAHGVAHFRERGQAVVRAFAYEDEMYTEAGLHGPLPIAGLKSAQLRCKLFAELIRDLAGWQRGEAITQHEQISHRHKAGIAADPVQLREQLHGVARKVCAVLAWVKIQLTEGELLLHAKLIGMRL